MPGGRKRGWPRTEAGWLQPPGPWRWAGDRPFSRLGRPSKRVLLLWPRKGSIQQTGLTDAGGTSSLSPSRAGRARGPAARAGVPRVTAPGRQVIGRGDPGRRRGRPTSTPCCSRPSQAGQNSLRRTCLSLRGSVSSGSREPWAGRGGGGWARPSGDPPPLATIPAWAASQSPGTAGGRESGSPVVSGHSDITQSPQPMPPPPASLAATCSWTGTLCLRSLPPPTWGDGTGTACFSKPLAVPVMSFCRGRHSTLLLTRVGTRICASSARALEDPVLRATVPPQGTRGQGCRARARRALGSVLGPEDLPGPGSVPERGTVSTAVQGSGCGGRCQLRWGEG